MGVLFRFLEVYKLFKIFSAVFGVVFFGVFTFKPTIWVIFFFRDFSRIMIHPVSVPPCLHYTALNKVFTFEKMNSVFTISQAGENDFPDQ